MNKLTTALAIAILALVGFNSASAEMVDIGLGQMEQSEFDALRAMVQGGQAGNLPTFSTALTRPERFGMVEMTRGDFKDLRKKMAGHDPKAELAPAVAAIQMVNIGTGEMPLDEFLALNRMVSETNGFKFSGLAAVQP